MVNATMLLIYRQQFSGIVYEGILHQERRRQENVEIHANTAPVPYALQCKSQEHHESIAPSPPWKDHN